VIQLVRVVRRFSAALNRPPLCRWSRLQPATEAAVGWSRLGSR